jgi:membrane associated rhomboid family serine protease
MHQNTIDSEFGKPGWKHLQVSFFLVLIMWVVKYVEIKTHSDFGQYGLYPGRSNSLFGIFTSPFLHADLGHLINNSWSFLVLGSSVAYFYSRSFWKVLGSSWLLVGLLTFFIGRPSFHIGASGIIYAFASFLFFSGLIRRHPRLLAASLMVVFLYGSFVWGVLPIMEHVSWEGHLSGAIVGLGLALLFRKEGPQRKRYEWDDEEEDAHFMEIEVYGVEEVEEEEPRRIVYHYKQGDQQ